MTPKWKGQASLTYEGGTIISIDYYNKSPIRMMKKVYEIKDDGNSNSPFRGLGGFL
jgi:hypothetical protein